MSYEWGYFPHTNPAFPQALIDGIVTRCNLPGLLAMSHASGTQVIEDFGEEHVRTGMPIAYTSADSVLQIAHMSSISASSASTRFAAWRASSHTL